MPELALDDDQWHALARHLHRVRVTELMRCEPTGHARLRCRSRDGLLLFVVLPGQRWSERRGRADTSSAFRSARLMSQSMIAVEAWAVKAALAPASRRCRCDCVLWRPSKRLPW